MIFRKKFVNIICYLMITVGLLCGCGQAENSKKLTDEQEDKVDIICRDLDVWNESYLDSAQYWPVNHVYISETEDGLTILTVGYLGQPKGSSMVSRTFVGVRSYAVLDKVAFWVMGYQTLEWLVHGLDIDLENMSSSEIKEVIEKSYLEYINKK